MEMMKKGWTAGTILALLLLVLCPPTMAASKQVKYDQMDVEELDLRVKKLNMGFEGYRLSHILTAEQKKIAQKNPVEKSFKGTYTFHDKGINIVVVKKTDKILALNLIEENADKKHFRLMMSSLMLEFGEPTTAAHDTLIYWVFNEDGIINEDLYRAMRKENNVNILATAKFSSKVRIAEIMDDKKDGKDNEPEKVTKQTEKGKNTIYCIVSSPPIVKRHVAEHRTVGEESKKEKE